MEQDSVSQEMAVWRALNWPGRRRMRLETEPIDHGGCVWEKAMAEEGSER
jgi:hypothetical protein